MYVLMSGFHSAPWLKLISSRRGGARRGSSGESLRSTRRPASFRLRIYSVAAAIVVAAASHPRAEDTATPDSVKSGAKFAEEGGDIYRSRCILCHGNSGGRGPNLFGCNLSEEKFVEIAINGRKGTQMPAFGYILSPDDVAKIHAFVTSRDSAF